MARSHESIPALGRQANSFSGRSFMVGPMKRSKPLQQKRRRAAEIPRSAPRPATRGRVGPTEPSRLSHARPVAPADHRRDACGAVRSSRLVDSVHALHSSRVPRPSEEGLARNVVTSTMCTSARSGKRGRPSSWLSFDAAHAPSGTRSAGEPARSRPAMACFIRPPPIAERAALRRPIPLPSSPSGRSRPPPSLDRCRPPPPRRRTGRPYEG